LRIDTAMSFINESYKNQNAVINITGHDFGGLLKMGDIIATLNVLEYMREANKNKSLMFHIPDSALQPGKEYVKIFRDFLIKNSDYLSATPGEFDFKGFVEIWGFREHNGHLVSIDCKTELKRKICIFPLLDAYYNTERNFTNDLLQSIINDFSKKEFIGYEKIICTQYHIPEVIDIKNFNISFDFKINLENLKDCEYFIGGDTGTSHLAGAMNNNPDKKLIFYYSEGKHGGWESVFTAPFHHTRENVKMIYFNKK